MFHPEIGGWEIKYGWGSPEFVYPPFSRGLLSKIDTVEYQPPFSLTRRIIMAKCKKASGKKTKPAPGKAGKGGKSVKKGK